VISASRGGGAGAGVHGRAGDILMDITAMAIHIMATRITATVTDTPPTDTVITVTGMVTDMATAANLTKGANTAPPLDQEWLSYSADCPVRAIITAQSMEFWVLRHAKRFGLTRNSTGT